MELSGNIQKDPRKVVANLNTQLQEGNSNTNIKTLVIIGNAKNKIDIDLKKRVIKVTTNKMPLSIMHHLYKTKIHTKTMVPQNTLNKSMNIEAQIRVLEKNRRKMHLQAKLKQLQAKKALKFSIQTELLTGKEAVAPINTKQLALK